MPVWPKTFYTFGLSLKTAATEWKLRHRHSAPAVQERTLASLTSRLAATKYWREAGVEADMAYDRFKSKVPLQTYEQLTPAIERMKGGESDVLWPGRCALFAQSSGTTTGQPRSVPVTEEMLAHFRQASIEALLYYSVRVRHAGVFRGRHLILGGHTALAPVAESAAHPAYTGELSSIIAVNLPAWAEKHLYEPGNSAAKIVDWEARLDAIVARTCVRDISLLAGVPLWVLELAREFNQRAANTGQRIDHLQSVWPNLECLVHLGMSVAPYAKELRALLGSGVKFHEVYAAVEGFIATQDSDVPGAGLRLMADLGVFFEFLPMSDFDPGRVEHLGAKAVSLADVKVGVDYALIVTTPGGLGRLVVGDVVRFVSKDPARLIHIGGTTLRLNTFGERVAEKDLTDALVAICGRHDWRLVNFHVAPLLATGSLTGQIRGRHEWWIELQPGTVATPIGPQIAAELDAEVQRSNSDYAARRKSAVLDLPVVRLVMPGVFEHWLRYRGLWGGQHKLSRCRADRTIADELAQITNFARD